MTSRRQVSPIPEYPRLRTRKACQICRRRKVKCDGVSPSCGQCSVRGALCYYKDDDKGTSELWGQTASSVNNPETESHKRRRTEPSANSNMERRSSGNTIHDTIYSGVTAVNSETESFIYYGPASTFSFIQHIHQELNSDGVEQDGKDGKDGKDVPEGLKKFGFRNLFLGGVPESKNDTRKKRNSVTFLDPIQANRYLDTFYKTLNYIMPMYPLSYMQSILKDMYKADNTNMRKGEAGLLGILAMGASLEGDDDWSDELFNRGSEIVRESSEVLSTDRVKVLMLLAHHQAMAGKFNNSYLLAGQAVRMAYACGLHREFPSLSKFSDASGSNEDRLTAVWSLYSFERLLSLSLGRPSAFSDNELDISFANNDFLRYMAPLGRISVKSSNLIYGLNMTSVSSIWDGAKEIDEELVQYQKDLPSNLRFEDFGKPGVTLHVDAFVIGTHFYLFKTLTYRPFLLIDSLLRKQQKQNSRQSADFAPYTEALTFLPEACKQAVNAGRGLLMLLAKSYSSDPLIAKLRLNSLFLQNACAILLFDILRDPSNKSEVTTNFEIINIALECYRLMESDAATNSGLALIEQVQAKAKEVFEGAISGYSISGHQTSGRPQITIEPNMNASSMTYASMESQTEKPFSSAGTDIYPQMSPSIVSITENALQNSSSSYSVGHDKLMEQIDSRQPLKPVPATTSTDKNLGEDGHRPQSLPLDLDSVNFWKSWGDGLDWLKAGFILPNHPMTPENQSVSQDEYLG
ncbi:hypothetical protein V1511DRAFT_494507 [Dipodascopsis uninucleata]